MATPLAARLVPVTVTSANSAPRGASFDHARVMVMLTVLSAARQQAKDGLEHLLIFAWFERLRIQGDCVGVSFGDGYARIGVPQCGHQLSACQHGARAEAQDGAGVGLAGFARVAALHAYTW